MYNSIYDLKAFYNGWHGRIVRRVLQQRIQEFWPDVKNMRIMGTGYAVPYLRCFGADSERVFAIMHASQGAHHWPQQAEDVNHGNLVTLSEEAELPIETASIDRILVVHDLEFSELLQPKLQELWRVLKSNGRILVIVPNRLGFWSRADWSPFGHGTPYTAFQICRHLRDNGFVHEKTEEALFMPPIRHSWLLKSAGVFEWFGRKYLPLGAGLHMVEASKQLYARKSRGSGSRVTIRGRNLMPSPIPDGF